MGIYVTPNIPTVSSSATSYTPTVTLVGGAGNTVPVYTTNLGWWSRAGNIYTVDIECDGDGGAEGAGTGQMNFALPVAASANHPSIFFPVGYALNNVTEYEIYAQIAGSASTIALRYFNLLTTEVNFTGADQNNTTRQVRLKFTYFV